jgi:hypothetical protein
MVDTLGFAKLLNETGNAFGLTRDVFHAEIEKRAQATRLAGESPQQAYTRIVLTPEGKELLKAYRNAPVGKPEEQEPQGLKPEPIGDASAELERLARSVARQKSISYERAYVQLLTDPSRAELARRVREEEMSATRAVRDSRWPIRAAEREFERDWRLGRNAASARD